MLINLMYGLPVMALCLVLQGLIASLALEHYSRRGNAANVPGLFGCFSTIVGVMFILVLGNVCQVIIWGLLFVFLGEFAQIQDAIYHSAVNFATLGYGDIVMSEKHRLLGPLESINGVLMIGVSTAVLMASFQDTMKKLAGARGKKA